MYNHTTITLVPAVGGANDGKYEEVEIVDEGEPTGPHTVTK